MLNIFRKPFERVFIGDSVPALVRWGRAVPKGIRRGLKDDAFRAVVQYAAEHQKFFARQLSERGIDAGRVLGPEDLGDIFTTADDLLNLPAEDFLCRPPEAVFETTGTSGEPKRLYFGYDELDAAALHEAAAFYENGVRPGDRVVCAFDAGYWISSWVTFLACKRLGVFCSAVGKPVPDEVYRRLGLYGYNVIVADPTWLVSLSEIAEHDARPRIKLIIAAGDRMTDPYRQYIEKVWGAPVILGYGLTEAGGGLGMECRERQGYHVDDYDFYLEIINRDEEGYGELVMTTLSRRTEPLLRYRVRDVTRFLEEPCRCGVRLQRLDRIRGRRDEMVVMGAGNLHPQIFERVLEGVEGVAERWQVGVRQEDRHDVLEFRFELTNGVTVEAVESAVRRNLQSRYPEIWANHLCNMYQLAFRFLPPGTLAQGRKPKRLVDERQA